MGIEKPTGIVSFISTSKAPPVLLPLFSTTMPKLTRSRPSILFRSLLMGAVVRLVLLIVPVKRGALPPGSVKVTGPCDARVNAPPSLLVWMTPLVIRKSGSVSVICLIAVENKAREPSCLNSWLVAWLVSFSPSPKGSSSTRTVNRKSAVVTLVGSGETLVKENVMHELKLS